MDAQRAAVCAILGLGAVVFVYAAINAAEAENPAVPGIQGEAQVMGLGVNAGLKFGTDTPLDMRAEVHQWCPGYDPDPSATPVVTTRHRYPVIPGGNVSTVMHKGWSSLIKDAPANNDWRINPPEVAVL